MIEIQIIDTDIAQLEVDSIICPIREDLTPTSSIGQKIWKVAGYEQMQQACQKFTVNLGLHFVQIDAKATGLRGNAQYIYNLKWQPEKDALAFYGAGLSLTRKDSRTAIPVLISGNPQDGVQIGMQWRRILRRIIQMEDAWVTHKSDRHIFLVTEDELVCEIVRLILAEEQEARKKELDARAHRKEQQKIEYLLAQSIDREKLGEYIELLYQIKRIEWLPAKQLENGVWQFGYPVYPKELFSILHIMEPDYEYPDHLKEMQRQKLRFSEFSLSQIQTYLTYLFRRERFCEGLIAEAVNHGTLLKLLLRIHDLMNPYPW